MTGPSATVSIDASVDAAVEHLDWASLAAQLDSEGHALLPGWLGAEAARGLARRFAASATARVPLAALGLGRGEALGVDGPLPAPLAAWRAALYRPLAGIANRWNETLGLDGRYPAALDGRRLDPRRAGPVRWPCCLSRLGAGDELLLHPGPVGDAAFPLRLVVLLSQPGQDFEGGDFVMTEQRPRMQSRPLVLPLRLGDAAIIATDQRPFQGGRGHYRVRMRHAIGRVRRGERLGLALDFPAAP